MISVIELRVDLAPSGGSGRRGLRPLALQLVLGAGCVASVAAAARLAPHAAARSERPGAWFLAASGVALVCWAAAALSVRRRGARLAAVLAVAAAVQLVPVASPLLFSRDVYGYWAYGRIAAFHDANAYRRIPAAFPRDPAVRAMARGWRRTTSVYGPLFTVGSEGGAVAVGDSPAAAAKFWQAAGGAGVLGLAVLAALVSPAPTFAAALVGWNPLLAIHFGGGGHNDVWMMVLLLGAFAAERGQRRRLAGALWAASAAVKWVPLALLPLRGAQGRRCGFSWGAFATVAAVIGTGATVLFGTGWLQAATPLFHNAAVGTRLCLPHLLRAVEVPGSAAVPLALAVAACGYLALLRSARLSRARLGLAAALLICTTPWLLPWYAVWAVPLAAAEDDALASGIAMLLSAYLLLAYRL